jgi:hypothetical protein
MKFILATLMAMVSIAFAQTATPTADQKNQLKVDPVGTQNYGYYDYSYSYSYESEDEVEIFSGEVLTVKRLLSAWLKNNKGKVIITDRLQSGDAKALVITVFYHRLPEPKVKEPVEPKEKK